MRRFTDTPPALLSSPFTFDLIANRKSLAAPPLFPPPFTSRFVSRSSRQRSAIIGQVPIVLLAPASQAQAGIFSNLSDGLIEETQGIGASHRVDLAGAKCAHFARFVKYRPRRYLARIERIISAHHHFVGADPGPEQNEVPDVIGQGVGPKRSHRFERVDRQPRGGRLRMLPEKTHPRS